MLHVSNNIYAAKIQTIKPYALEELDCYERMGNWQGDHKALHVEIGCNAGHVTIAWAEKNPHIFFIGIDYKYKAIYRAAEKAKKKNLSNVIFIHMHANTLEKIFKPSEVDAFFVFFPDPWEKKSQRKNRFLTTTSFQMLASLTKKNGTLSIKTDHDEYFARICEAIPDTWRVTHQTKDLHAGWLKLPSIPDVTLFEQLFMTRAIPIKAMDLVCV